MGQRHQMYVVQKKKNEYGALGAFHHQWCYGLRATSNVVRFVEALLKAKTAFDGKWSEYTCNDRREIDTLMKAIYGVDLDGTVSMVHNEAEYLIDENDNIRPERGDNNDGAMLVIVDQDAKEIRACMFTPAHVEGKHGKACKKWKSYTVAQYLAFYYDEKELNELRKGADQRVAIVDHNVKHIAQEEFKIIMKAAMKGGE